MQSTISLTPATRAATVVIRTVEGYAARPPGIYAPILSSGVVLTPRVIPGSISSSQRVFGFWSSWKAVILASASINAWTSSGSTMSYAASICSCVILRVSSFCLSNFSVRAKSAASPFVLTSSMMPDTMSFTSFKEPRRCAFHSSATTGCQIMVTVLAFQEFRYTVWLELQSISEQ